MSTNNSQTIQPYLFFNGRCEEALAFYRKTMGAEVTFMMRFKDSPEPSGCGPVPGDKIMHASVRIGQTNLMASDGRCEGKPSFEGFALSYIPANEAEAQRVFGALAQGGQVQQPLGKTFFSPCFGMVRDQFGLFWMIYIPGQ